ncbi:MAG: methyltransferase domain-containing protein [Candidatus Aenigmatarchaeota archaeon]
MNVKEKAKIYSTDYYKSLNKLLKENVKGNKIFIMGTHADNDVKQFLDKDVLIIDPFNSFFKEYKEEFEKFKNIKIKKMLWEDINVNKIFDCVICCDCIEHSKKPYKILNKITKLSNRIILSCPNGFWWFRDAHRYEDHGHGAHISHFTIGELKKFFKQRGYKVEIRGLLHYPWLRGIFSLGIFLKAVKNEKT